MKYWIVVYFYNCIYYHYSYMLHFFVEVCKV